MKDEMNAENILHIARSFTRARILLSAVELDLFTLLSGDPLTAAGVADTLGSNLRSTTILLDALAAMGLLAKEEGFYRTHTRLIPLLASGSPESLFPALMHSAHLFRTWSQLTDVVLAGGPADKGEADNDARTRAFIGAMHVGALRVAEDVVKAVNPGKARRLIDIGGGSGSYTIGFLKAFPGMTATLFDLPDVINMARDRLTAEGLIEQITLVAGDYNRDALPGGHDLAFLSAIIHQNSHSQNVALYENAFKALEPGGRIVIRDYAMSSDRIRPASGALFAVNMLVNTTGGNSYTFDEIREGLKEAGFHRIRLLLDSEMSSLVEGWKQ